MIEKLNDSESFPASDNAMMKVYYNETQKNLQELRPQTNGCHVFKLDSITLTPEQLTPCDMGAISAELWNRWVDTGAGFVTSKSFQDAHLFGVNQETYFSPGTNAAQSAQQRASGQRRQRGHAFELWPSPCGSTLNS